MAAQHRVCARRAALGVFALRLVCRRDNRQHAADRLDPITILVLINEADHRFSRRSSSAWAKKADAVFEGPSQFLVLRLENPPMSFRSTTGVGLRSWRAPDLDDASPHRDRYGTVVERPVP